MCMSRPNIKPPDPVQEAKTPDFTAQRDARKKLAMKGGSTLLTGPTGIDLAAGNAAKPTLLGS
jgi:hypothetical protein